VLGVTVAKADEAPLPLALAAVTLQEYETPLVRPVTVTLSVFPTDAECRSVPSLVLLQVAVYPVIGLPFESAAAQVREAWPFPPVASGLPG